MSVGIVGRAIRDSLRDNLIDPLGRINSQWIHYKRVPVNASDVGKTPTVYIEPIPSSGGYDITGTAKRHRAIRFWITVVGSIGDRGMVDGQPITSAEEIIGLVSDKIYTHLWSNSTSITTVGQPNATSTNMISAISIVDGVGGMFDISANKMGNRLVIEILENW